MKKILLIIAALFVLPGCTELLEATKPTDGSAGLGTHSYTVAPDGSLQVEVHSIYGGPSVIVEGEGENRKMVITPASRIQIEKLIDVLSIP